MSKALVIIDMQNDFITGPLGSPEAVAIVPKIAEKANNYNGFIFTTQDTHDVNYLNTQEGEKLPIPHCIKNTKGWEIENQISEVVSPIVFETIYKDTFGSFELAKLLASMKKLTEVELVGVCTDICVISNALILKAALPEVRIIVDSSCCAGVTPASHETALAAMRLCQIEVI